MERDAHQRIFTASQIITVTTAAGAGDLMTLLTSSMSRVELLALNIQQITSAPAAMSVELFRGSTSVGAGGTAVPSVPLNSFTTYGSTSTVLGPPSAANSTASAVRIAVGGFESGNGEFEWEPCYPPSMNLNQTFHARVSQPSSAVSLAMMLTYREIGKMPS